MRVEIVVTPKLTKTVIANKFKVVDGALLFYADNKMTQLIEGFKVWRRFNVLEEANLTKLVEVSKSKNKKGA